MENIMKVPKVITLDYACTQDSIAVLWEKVEGAVGYEVFIEDEFATLTESTDYTFEGLEADGEYEVYVCAVDEDGSRIRSEAVIMHTRKAARVHNIMDYGAKACEIDNPIMTDTDRMPDCTGAIQQAINECGEGDMVYVPEGTFVAGALFLKSNMTLKVDGRLFGSSRLSDYPVMSYRFEGRESVCYASLINTTDGRRQNITICGKGTIDANGRKLFMEELKEKRAVRGRAVCIRNTDGVYLKDITIRQSPAWCLHTIYCNNVVLNNVKIFTKYAEDGRRYEDIYNGDGFDPDSCSNVYVFNCLIGSQDDCIAIKSGRDEEGRKAGIPSEDIRITNCRFTSGFGVAVGSETSGDVRRVLVQDCIFEDTYSFASVKSPRGRGSMVEDICYENCVHENNSTEHHDCRWFRGALYVDEFYGVEEFDENSAMPVNEGTPHMRNIHFKNIDTKTVAGNAVFITGLVESPLENITLENVRAKGIGGMKANNIDGLTLKAVEIKGSEGNDYAFNNVNIL